MTALTAVLMTLKSEAEGKLVTGSCHFAAARAEWNGRILTACAELPNQNGRRRSTPRTYWRVNGKRVALAKVEAALS